jgi:hypothetical protein
MRLRFKGMSCRCVFMYVDVVEVGFAVHPSLTVRALFLAHVYYNATLQVCERIDAYEYQFATDSRLGEIPSPNSKSRRVYACKCIRIHHYISLRSTAAAFRQRQRNKGNQNSPLFSLDRPMRT